MKARTRVRIKSLKLEGRTLPEQADLIRAALINNRDELSSKWFAKWVLANMKFIVQMQQEQDRNRIAAAAAYKANIWRDGKVH